MKKTFVLIPVLVAVLLVSGCTQGTQPSAGTGGTTAPTGEVREFDMTAKRFEFVPNTITVNKGDTVKLHIESIDVTHGFALPDFGVSANLAPGKDVHVEFVADKKGTFPFYCSVVCGSGHSGMNGQLIVK